MVWVEANGIAVLEQDDLAGMLPHQLIELRFECGLFLFQGHGESPSGEYNTR